MLAPVILLPNTSKTQDMKDPSLSTQEKGLLVETSAQIAVEKFLLSFFNDTSSLVTQCQI
jgi:hypothetical protein